jgi:prophage DNA circulation protein
VLRLARRREVSTNQLRLLAAQHTHAYTPPILNQTHAILLGPTRMGREFDQIMREARQAGVKERRSYHQRIDAKRNGRRNRKTRSTASSCRTSQREPRLWLSGVDESSTGTTRLPVILTFRAHNDTSRNEVGFLLHTLHILQCSACFVADNTTVILKPPSPIESPLLVQ